MCLCLTMLNSTHTHARARTHTYTCARARTHTHTDTPVHLSVFIFCLCLLSLCHPHPLPFSLPPSLSFGLKGQIIGGRTTAPCPLYVTTSLLCRVSFNRLQNLKLLQDQCRQNKTDNTPSFVLSEATVPPLQMVVFSKPVLSGKRMKATSILLLLFVD